jgi:hypothetical protein
MEAYDEWFAEVMANGGSTIEDVPPESRDYQQWLAEVRNNVWALTQVPEQLRDYNMCKLAVTRDGWMLAYVPHNLRDYEMCKQAIVNDYPGAIKHVPVDLAGREFLEMIASAK